MEYEVVIEKLVYGGQGLGTLPDGRKVFAWNALPGETVRVRLLKGKRSFAEGLAVEILRPSPDRIAPEEPGSYLATSPWQMMSFPAEDRYKKDILAELFAREKVELPEFAFTSFGAITGYRNKMEWGFWGDEDGLSLAHFVRGSHGKTKVTGSILANDFLNDGAASLLAALQGLGIRAGDLKSVIVRTSGHGRRVVAALFVKREDFPNVPLPKYLQGLAVYYSNPKSPASVPTKLLSEVGERTLADSLLGVTLQYDVLSFFQVNLGIFEIAMQAIADHLGSAAKIDLFSGVGAIGIPLGADTLVESDPLNVAMAKRNAGHRSITVVQAASESALDRIVPDKAVIVDPPRAGLHAAVVNRFLAVRPPQIAYLSCNPATQARDLRLLTAGGYKLKHFAGYNFFPRTPHIESLAILKKK